MSEPRGQWWASFHGARLMEPEPITYNDEDTHIPLPAVDIPGSGYELDDLAVRSYRQAVRAQHQAQNNGLTNVPSYSPMRAEALASINPTDLIASLPPIDKSFDTTDFVEYGFVCPSPVRSEASFSALDAHFLNSLNSVQPTAETANLFAPAAPASPVRMFARDGLLFSPLAVSARAPVDYVQVSQAVPQVSASWTSAPMATPGPAHHAQSAAQVAPLTFVSYVPASSTVPPRAAPRNAAPRAAASRAAAPRAAVPPAAAPRVAAPGNAAPLAAPVPVDRSQRTVKNVSRVTRAPAPSSTVQSAAQDTRLAAPASLDHVQSAAWNVPMDVSAPAPVGSAQFTGQNVPLGVSVSVPVGSALCSGSTPLASTPLAAFVPLDLVEFAALNVALANHPLEGVVFTPESIASFTSSRHTDCLSSSSLEEAAAAYRHVGNPPEDDTIPRDTATKKVLVWLLCVALQTVQFADDGPATLKLFPKVASSRSLVELRAWQLLDRMIYRHMDGESLIPDSKGKEFPTFLDRFNAVFGVLMRRKSLAKRCFDAPDLDHLVENPVGQETRAASNAKVNRRKKTQLDAGKEALAAAAEREDSGRTESETPAPATPGGQETRLPTPPDTNDGAAPTAGGSRKRGASCDAGGARKRLNFEEA